MKVRKLPLRRSAAVVCCPLPIFKPSLGRREKLPQKVAWRREIYPSIPPPSLLEKGASSVLPSYFRLGGLPGLVHGKIGDAWLENQRFNPTQAYDGI